MLLHIRPPISHHLPCSCRRSHCRFRRHDGAATNVFGVLVALCVHLFLCVVVLFLHVARLVSAPPIASHVLVTSHLPTSLTPPLIPFVDLPLATIGSPVTTLPPTIGPTTDAEPRSHCRALASVAADPPPVSCHGPALVSAGLSLLLLVCDSSSSLSPRQRSAVSSISCAAPRPAPSRDPFPCHSPVAGARCLFRCPNSAPRRLTNHTLRTHLLLEVCSRLLAQSVVCCDRVYL